MLTENAAITVTGLANTVITDTENWREREAHTVITDTENWREREAHTVITDTDNWREREAHTVITDTKTGEKERHTNSGAHSASDT